ncbi:DNA/RNA helicase domain-containing protein [Pilimelia columellifera]|uniref:DUF2075 domain-containing protein n=1 Tax=Pilimelia columellifera subsp. columellifera TaxID=706583 RepID=A0ABN3N6R8_9ACTN
MSAFRRSAATLSRLANEGTLADQISHHLRANRVGVGPAERRSWEASLGVLSQDLLDAGLADVEVLVEYSLPLTSKRADAVLAGTHPVTGGDSYIVVELKQWSATTSFDGSDELFAVPQMAAPQLHPGIQVSRYCQYLTDFVGALDHDPGALCGVAYLHNAADDQVQDLLRLAQTEQSRLFTSQRRGRFLDFLRGLLSPASGARAADRLLDSAVRPSRQLLTHASRELTDRSQFVLLDEQQVAYELVLNAVRHARAANRKTAVVIEGGPGSGKSVIALSVMAELARQGRTVIHATGSRSFTETLRRYAAKGSTRTKNLFKYFNSFMVAEANGIDVLLCDEAHRVRETSANRFTRREVRERSRPQLDELMTAAHVPVFLLDEHQIVRPGETGSAEAIVAFARATGLDVQQVRLEGQFRCGGSLEYERWVLGLLGLDGAEQFVWTGDGLFELTTAESPVIMEMELAQSVEQGWSGRIAAGYRWPWSDPSPEGKIPPDVVIGDWARPWNLKSDRAVGDAPGSAFWATDPRGFGQVGCVYTAQGFEYDWSGVIIGPDLVARDGQLVTRREHSKDPALRSRKTLSDDDADQLIRNTYKVLLTRGMRGTTVHSTDPETREHLAALIRPVVELARQFEPLAPGVYRQAPGESRATRPGDASMADPG